MSLPTQEIQQRLLLSLFHLVHQVLDLMLVVSDFPVSELLDFQELTYDPLRIHIWLALPQSQLQEEKILPFSLYLS